LAYPGFYNGGVHRSLTGKIGNNPKEGSSQGIFGTIPPLASRRKDPAGDQGEAEAKM